MDTQISIIPYPTKINRLDGSLKCRPVLVLSEPFFSASIETVYALLAQTNLGKSKARANQQEEAALPLYVQKDESLANKEAYTLTITKNTITVTAAAAHGAFYAIETLRQLALTQDEIPCVSIKDEPAYCWRGFMLDTCRSFFPVSFIEKLIDVAAFHKLNTFHWHLTDDQGWRLPVPEYPELTKTGAWRTDRRLTGCTEKVCGGESQTGFYSDEEIAEVVAFAAKRFVTVVPEIEIPGHASALLASYPNLGCTGGPYHVEDRWGIFPDIVCAGNDDLFTLYGKVFDTICRLFPSPWVHIGGDECIYDNWKRCPKCQARMKQEHIKKEAGLQAWITSRVATMLQERGKTAIGWDEVLNGVELFKLPPSLIVQSWRGVEGGQKASSLKHQVIMSPQNEGCYFDHKPYDSPLEPGRLGTNTVKSVYDYSPFLLDADEGQNAYVLGGECVLWTEEIPYAKTAEYLLFPRICAMAESLWLPREKKDFTRFTNMLPAHEVRLDKLDIQYYKGPLF